MNQKHSLQSPSEARPEGVRQRGISLDELNQKFLSDAPALCVSLIHNHFDLAQAVEDAGADGIKVHINLNHPHAGVRLGSFEEEADALHKIVSSVSIPVGIVPRGASGTTAEEVQAFAEFGFAFVDLYSGFMSPEILAVPNIGKWVAPRVEYTSAMLETLSHVSGIDVIEAAFLPIEKFGVPLSVDDLVRLRLGLKAISGRKPLVLPTDRALTERDLPALMAAGISNYLIGYAVTGSDLESVVSTTKRFRQALDGSDA